MKTKLIRIGLLGLALLATLLASAPSLNAAPLLTCTSQSSGTWNTIARWSCGRVPISVDDVTIQSTHTISYDLASSTIQSLTVNGTLNFNAAANDSLTVTGDVVINGPSGAIAAVSASGTRTHTLNVGANFTNNDTFTAVGGDDVITVVLNGSAAQTIGGSSTTTFENLTLSNTAATINATTNFNVNGTMAVNANAVFSPAAAVVIGGATNTINGSGTIQVTRLDTSNAYAGQYAFTNDTLTSMTVDFAGAGNQEIDALTYGALRTSGSGTKTTAGDFTVNGNVTAGSGTTLALGANDDVTMSTANSTLTVNGTIDFGSSGSFQSANSGTHIVTTGANGLIRLSDADGLGPAASNTSFQTNSSGQWNLTSLETNGTVEYYNAGNQAVTDRNYNNLTFSGSGNKTWTQGAPRTVNGNLILSGTANFALTNSTLNPLTVNGDWTHSSSGTFTHSGGTVVFARNGTATLSRAGAGSTETFCRVTINAGTLLDTTDDFVAVSGGAGCTSLTVTGALRREAPAQSITNGAAVSFNHSQNLVAATVTQTSGANFGATNLTVTLNQSPASVSCGGVTLGGAPVLRHFNITPTTLGGAATLRLYYNNNELNGNTNPAEIAIYHCNGTAWVRLTGTYTNGSDANGSYVELPGVTEFSPFAIGGAPGSPTAVTLSTFGAEGTANDTVMLLGLGLGVITLLSGAGYLARRKSN